MTPFVEIKGEKLRRLSKGEHIVELDEEKVKVSVMVQTEGSLELVPETEETFADLHQGGTLILDPTDEYRSHEGISFRGFNLRSKSGDEKHIFYIHPEIADVLDKSGVLEIKPPDTEKQPFSR